MILHTLWAWRKNEEGPELLEAWDEVTRDNWPEGFKEACQKALDAMEADIGEAGHRYVDIDVDYDTISALFWETPTVAGEVVALNQNRPSEEDS